MQLDILHIGIRACSGLFLITLLFACTTASNPNNVGATQSAGISTLTPGWNSFAPGGDTLCSDGTPYRFFVRPGDPAKLMVFFQGGGACWTRETCDPNDRPTYTVNISADYTPAPFGAFNFTNPDNPFKDHTVVMAPYCSADVHLGAAQHSYPATAEGGQAFTIFHRGRANAQAVLDWTFTNVPNPKQVFVTGSSAGAIPSPFYASVVANHYTDARVAHLGDGAGGYRQMNGGARPDEHWGTFDFITQEPGFENLKPDGFNYEQLYIAAAKAHPDILFAEYDAAEDNVQKQFLALGGISDVSLLGALNANHADIQGAVRNFRAFISGGASHTILRRPEFYSYGVGNRSVRDWVADLANFVTIEDVRCSSCDRDTYTGGLPGPMQAMWDTWEDPTQQYVEPFKIFDNLYYVGINWVAAYVLETSEGLILIDTLYGKWVNQVERNMRKLGLNPADVKYIINTHGHFDHAGGTRYFQQAYGARVVMAQEDWSLAESKPDLAAFYMPIPQRDIVAADGDTVTLGDTRVTLLKTPGHTEGVLSLLYEVRDGEQTYNAITLGGVGLNFTGVKRTQDYLASYNRLQSLQNNVSVSLPNHAAMGRVLERGKALAQRRPEDPHPFVDPVGYQKSLATFIANAQEKLAAEKAGRAKDPLAELSRALEGQD